MKRCNFGRYRLNAKVLLTISISLCVFFGVTYIMQVTENRKETIKELMREANQQLYALQKLRDELIIKDDSLEYLNDRFMVKLGYSGTPHLLPEKYSYIGKVSVPVILTYGKRGNEEITIGFVRNIKFILPDHMVLVYDVGMEEESRLLLKQICDDEKCRVTEFDLNGFPTHIRKYDTLFFRPLIIQDALEKYGIIMYMECNVRLLTADLGEVLKKASVNGIAVSPLKASDTLNVHGNMFRFFNESQSKFRSIIELEPSLIVLYNVKKIHYDIMLPWLKCVIARSCILPRGENNLACDPDKKDNLHYDGCQKNDILALSIVLAKYYKFDYNQYALPMDMKSNLYKITSNVETNVPTPKEFYL